MAIQATSSRSCSEALLYSLESAVRPEQSKVVIVSKNIVLVATSACLIYDGTNLSQALPETVDHVSQRLTTHHKFFISRVTERKWTLFQQVLYLRPLFRVFRLVLTQVGPVRFAWYIVRGPPVGQVYRQELNPPCKGYKQRPLLLHYRGFDPELVPVV